MTVDSIGDIEQTIQEVAKPLPLAGAAGADKLQRERLAKERFACVVAHNGKFKASNLRGSDFSGADLTGSAFDVSDAREANFDGANLTDCTLSQVTLQVRASIKPFLCAPNLARRS